MKHTTITCDKCGKTRNDFKTAKSGGYSDHSEVKITYDLRGEFEKENYRGINLDLCGECTEEFHKHVKKFLKKPENA